MNLFFWKHKEKPEVIKQECYDKLPPHRQVNYIPTKEQPTHYVDRVDRSASSGDDGFITSAIIGYATNSTMLGTLGGGNLAGAFVGEMLHGDDTQPDPQYGGGTTGGGGASGSFETPDDNSSNDDDKSSNDDNDSSNDDDSSSSSSDD